MTKPTHGFTLIEMIIFVAVAGVVLTAATFFAYEFISTRTKTLALEEVHHNARFAMARLGAEIRTASDINLGGSVFGSNPATLSLATSSGSTNPTVFTVTSGVLQVQQGAGPVLPLTSSRVEVADFTVSNVSTSGRTKAVHIKLKIRHLNPGALQTFNVESTLDSTHRLWKSDGFSF